MILDNRTITVNNDEIDKIIILKVFMGVGQPECLKKDPQNKSFKDEPCIHFLVLPDWVLHGFVFGLFSFFRLYLVACWSLYSPGVEPQAHKVKVHEDLFHLDCRVKFFQHYITIWKENSFSHDSVISIGEQSRYWSLGCKAHTRLRIEYQR